MDSFFHFLLYLVAINSKCFLLHEFSWMIFKTNLNDGVRNNNDGDRLGCMTLDNFYDFTSPNNLSSLAILGISSVNLKTLKADSFRRTTNLTDIFIRSSINKIEIGAFNGLEQKKIEIRILENDIPVLAAQTFNFSGKFLLSLNNNKIKEVEPGTFGNIEAIYLHHNSITKIKKGVFSNLDIALVNLASNQINFIEDGAFHGMTNLKYLSLDNNKLQHIDLKKLFGEITNLGMLYLNHNPLFTIENNMFVSTPNLKLLGLSSISISELPKNIFENLEFLEFLEIKGNNLSYIDPDVFPKKNNLTYLFLNGNDLTYLEPELLSKFNNLQYIAMYNNPWQCGCKDELYKWANEKNVTVFCENDIKCIENSKCDYEFKINDNNLTLNRMATCERAWDFKQYLYYYYKEDIFGLE